MSSVPLSIRLVNNSNNGNVQQSSAAVATFEEDSVTPESPRPPSPGNQTRNSGRGSFVGPFSIENGDPNAAESNMQLPPGLGSNHQFWLKDAKIVEDLFTIHRSAKHLLEFTSTLIGNHDTSLAQRPIPVMSNGDVLFMTQLSNDIARSVGGISAVRHHGQRVRKRNKIRNLSKHHYDTDIGGPSNSQQPVDHNHSAQRHSRGSNTGSMKRQHQEITKSDDGLLCSRCGRTETPEWRKGPNGLLCNVCGLVYAKQRRKLKGG